MARRVQKRQKVMALMYGWWCQQRQQQATQLDVAGSAPPLDAVTAADKQQARQLLHALTMVAAATSVSTFGKGVCLQGRSK